VNPIPSIDSQTTTPATPAPAYEMDLLELSGQFEACSQLGASYILTPASCALLARALTSGEATPERAGEPAYPSDRERLLYVARVLRWFADTMGDYSLKGEALMALGTIKRVLDVRDEDCEALGLTSSSVAAHAAEAQVAIGLEAAAPVITGGVRLRERFESFAKTKELDLSRGQWPEDPENYLDWPTRAAWLAYQEATPLAPLARGNALADLDARSRVAGALGLPTDGLRDGKPVSYAWSYLLSCVKDAARSSPDHIGAAPPTGAGQ
jgi:hypothetical protein